MKYRSRYVHKIAPRATDYGPDVEVDPSVGSDRKALGAAMRQHKLLDKGERLLQCRVEPDGRIVAFPAASIWWSIVLEPVKPEPVNAPKPTATGEQVEITVARNGGPCTLVADVMTSGPVRPIGFRNFMGGIDWL